jgi:hypothetical protein
MKRIVGTFMLLAGLSGCITYTAAPFQPEKMAADTRSATPGYGYATANVVGGGTNVPLPSVPTWDMHPDHVANGSYAGSTAARPQAWTGAPTNSLVASVSGMPATVGALPAAPVPLNASPTPSTVAAGPMPSLVPVVTTPKPAAIPSASGVVQAAVPEVITPGMAQSSVQQTSFTSSADPKVGDSKAEASLTKAPVPATPAAPSSKGSTASETKVAKMGTPIMRLVNSKRITLNFEIKDVGPSGLAGVELWYTQDCREWKKYDAPAKAKAYVVEVDEEGMYGFTLLARSGLGLAKEAPAPGDQPMVWVIVDLTSPDVQLTEVTPKVKDKTQQVSINWKATDKNLGRQPISLFYADKEEGPWKTIATNLPNSGKYLWQVPADAPPCFLVKAEAIDLAGNVGRTQTPKTVLLDTHVPSVSILNVDGKQ